MTIDNKKEIEELMKDKNFRAIVDWRVKNDFLKKQINTLGKLDNFPIIIVAVFLLKAQLIEFELKQLITSLDLHLAFSNPDTDIRLKPRTPRDLDEDKMTLGGLNKIIQRYEGKFLEKLQSNLGILVRLRNNFVHKLFNIGTLKSMINASDKGLKLTNKIILDIENIEAYLKANDPFRKFTKEVK